MEVSKSDSPMSLRLKDWIVPPRQIGRMAYQGRCVMFETMQTTYQQQSTTFGRTAGVGGFIWDGYGGIGGGGGFVDTVHRGVVTAIVRYEDGKEEALELPAQTALREGSIGRIDYVNHQMAFVRNLSGGGAIIALRSPADYIALPMLTKRDAFMSIIGVCMLPAAIGSLAIAGVAAVLIGLPAWTAYTNLRAKAERKGLARFMLEVAE